MNSCASVLVTLNSPQGRKTTAIGAIGPKVGTCFILLVAFLVCLVGPLAHAQLYAGSVAGMVHDSSGAMISGAKLTLTDKEKGYDFSASTDPGGRYVFRSIPPGTYKLSARATGFKTEVKEGIILAVNQNASIDFTMNVGAVNEVLEVQASGVQLQTEDAVTGQVIDRRLINDLPLVGRDVLNLAYLTPGITAVDNQCNGCTDNNFISNGSRNATADILLDGVSSTNFEQNSGILAPTYTPSVDAVQEFKVQQSNFSAEYGFTGATLVNVITRSGTNQFHGSLYEFVRNDKFDANDWFNDFNGVKKAPLRRNDFGGTVGGPIIKNKAFFFFDYEGNRNRDFATGTAGVPTALMRTGNFSELCTLRGGSFDNTGLCSVPAGQLWDPYSVDTTNPANTTASVTRQTFIPNNNLAAYKNGALIDPVAQKLINMFPLPNRPIGAFGDLAGNFFVSGTDKFSQNQFDVKIDYRFSENKLLSGKYAERRNQGHNLNCFAAGGGNPAFDPCTQGPTQEHDHLGALNYTQTLSPKLVMNLSYGITRGAVHNPGIRGDFPNIDPVTDLGMPNYMDVSGFKQYPQIRIVGYQASNRFGGTNIGTQTFSIIREGQETHTAQGALDWVRGKHELKFGGEMRVHRINFAQPGWPAGSFRFDSTGTSQLLTPDASFGTVANPNSGSGDGMASFLIGVGTMLQPQPNACGGGNCPYEVPNNVATQNFQWAAFIQDNFRATPKLTLNLGLRYELSLPRTERFNRMNWLDPNLQYTLQPNPSVVPGAPPLTVRGGEVFASPSHRYNYDTFYKAFQPRFGLAYQLPHSTVVRGGYGIYFSTPRSGASGTGPWGFQGFDEQTPWIPSLNNQTVLPGATLSNPFPPVGPKLPPGNALGPLNDVGFPAVGPIPRESRNIPYEQAWSFGLQKELPSKILVDASYIGKKGTHLYLGGFRDHNFLGPALDHQLITNPAFAQQLATTPVPNPFFGYITDPLSDLSGATVPAFQLLKPYPQFDSFSGDSPPIANSIYHAAQFRVEKPFANGLEFLVTYTISKSIDNASTTDDSISWLGGGLSGGTLSVQDPNNLRAERSLSTFDIPQVLQFSYVYALPVGRGKKFGSNLNPIVNGFIGGWQLNGIWRFDNGRPVVLALNSPVNIPTYNQRPNLTGPLQVNNSSNVSMVTNYFRNACDPALAPCLNGDPVGVVQQPANYTLGNAPRAYGGVRVPPSRNVSMALFKEFPMASLREGMRMEVRVEAFNAFNHPQFDAPDTFYGDGSFGQITSTSQANREIQLGLKLYF